ncbi:MAG: arginine--tRNA ligase [Actinomycetota bacterium]
MIQASLASALNDALVSAQAAGKLPDGDYPPVGLERPGKRENGDWATGFALQSAKAARMKPREIADILVAHLSAPDTVATVEVAGPGFINFYLTHAWLTGMIREIERAGDAWGRIEVAELERIQVEFVSANPTGPLHLGHGRWAAIGDSLGNVLAAAGHTVEREFYVNDHGRQIDLFGRSIVARYLGVHGREAAVPEGGYQGAYVIELAKEITAEVGDRYVDAPEDERLAFFKKEGVERMTTHQRAVLERFGVTFDVWFSEASLHAEGAVQRVIDYLRELGHVYEQDGALWLRTTDFGDDKDRVLMKSDGDLTYIAPDIAYFMDKVRRGFTRLIYLWGADHHGYVQRLLGAIRALGEDPDHAEIIIGQLVNLTKGGVPVRMSKRTGELITFDELLDEVGKDAARYLLVRQGADTPLDFDMEQALARSQDNPVFYVQYAHARIASIVRHAAEQGIALAPVEEVALTELQHESEQELLRKLAELPEIVEVAAALRAPHRIARYAEELAADFHAFYRDCRVVSDDESLTQARLHLCRAAQITLANALRLLGVTAPEKM